MIRPTQTCPRQYSGKYPRLSRGRPGFDSPPGRTVFQITQKKYALSVGKILTNIVNKRPRIMGYARLAQSVEHQTFNLRVAGSSPSSGAGIQFRPYPPSSVTGTGGATNYRCHVWVVSVDYMGCRRSRRHNICRGTSSDGRALAQHARGTGIDARVLQF